MYMYVVNHFIMYTYIVPMNFLHVHVATNLHHIVICKIVDIHDMMYMYM